MNIQTEKMGDEAIPSFHHGHALHQSTKAFVRDVPSGCGFNEGQIQLDPFPLVQ